MKKVVLLLSLINYINIYSQTVNISIDPKKDLNISSSYDLFKHYYNIDPCKYKSFINPIINVTFNKPLNNTNVVYDEQHTIVINDFCYDYYVKDYLKIKIKNIQSEYDLNICLETSSPDKYTTFVELDSINLPKDKNITLYIDVEYFKYLSDKKEIKLINKTNKDIDIKLKEYNQIYYITTIQKSSTIIFEKIQEEDFKLNLNLFKIGKLFLEVLNKNYLGSNVRIINFDKGYENSYSLEDVDNEINFNISASYNDYYIVINKNEKYIIGEIK